MEDKRELKLIGITYNQIKSGVYALILEEVEGNRRIPIIIGYPEYQAIECRLQEVKMPRPLTHDIMATTLSAFGIELTEINIRRLPNGVFAAFLSLRDSMGNKKQIDSRSSDAIALAIRLDAPIFTTEEVLRQSGFSTESKEEEKSDEAAKSGTGEAQGRPASDEETYGNMTPEELSEHLAALVAEERYEEAAKLKEIIEKLKGK